MWQRYVLSAMAIVPALLLTCAAWGSTFKVLHNFAGGIDGQVPLGSVVIDREGNLYGTTGAGGTGQCEYGCGVVFELTAQPSGEWDESFIFDFTTESGGASPGGIAVDAALGLFVSTIADVPGGPALVAELMPDGSGWSFNPIYNQPGCCLADGQNGNLLGVIGPGNYFGVGAVGELTPTADGWIYSQLYSFCSQPKCVDGYDVKWPLTPDAEGNIYGATYFGGNGYGLAFELTHNRASSSIGDSWTYHIMHRFGAFPTDGGYPGSGLVLDGLGNAYGVSYNGGANGTGAVYELTPFPAAPWLWTETQIYNFPLGIGDGGFPEGNLVFDQAGNLYGSAGGGTGCNAYGCGVIFKLTSHLNGQWSYSVVHYFDGEDGFGPNPLAIDGNGNLFGTTSNGGTYNLGVAFEITP